MNLLGFLKNEKAVPFPQFRDMVRLVVRRNVAGAKIEPTDDGFVISQDNKPPTRCNLKQLYLEYTRAPRDSDMLIARWLGSLVMHVPEHTWVEGQMTLRPTLKPAGYLASAHRQMQKNTPPDSLPFAPFAGELSVIIMRDLPGTAVAVTQSTLDIWSVSFEAALRESMNNMNMMTFPPVANALHAGVSAKRGAVQEEVGLVFEGDHLTATWLVIERFRDYVTQRLQGDYVVAVPLRGRLIAIRADEPGLIAQVGNSNRSIERQPHALTSSWFHVSGSMTGGVVTVFQPGLAGGKGEKLDPNSVFAKGGQAVASGSPAHAVAAASTQGGRPKPVDLSDWGGLTEATDDTPPPPLRRGRH